MTAISTLTTGKILILTFLLGIIAGCESEKKESVKKIPVSISQTSNSDRVFYSVFISRFFDSDSDGIGDINGITQKLNYLKSLGINGLHLTSLYSSAHEYNIRDYRNIDSQYGTIDDFKKLLAKAKEKDITVILELPVTATSNKHPWFLNSQKNHAHFKKFYNWKVQTDISESEFDRYAKNGGENQENYYRLSQKGMPELNFDNPAVRDSVKSIAKYWLDLGADGFKITDALQAYPFSEKDKEQNMWKSISWWAEFSEFVKITKPTAYLVADVWESEEIAIEFAKNGLDANFNSDLSKNIINAIKEGKDIHKFAETLAEYHDNSASEKGKFKDVIFLSKQNQNRIGSELNGDTSRIKLAASILFTLPGTPFLRYGEEIGMLGEKSSETEAEPMIWHEFGAASGQTHPHEIKYNLKTPPAAVQFKNPNSVLTHYRKMIEFRKKEPLISSGEFSWIGFDNQPKTLTCYMFRKDEENLFVFHNLAEKGIKFDWFPMTKEGIALIHRGSVEGEKEKSQITIRGFGTVVLKAKR